MSKLFNRRAAGRVKAGNQSSTSLVPVQPQDELSLSSSSRTMTASSFSPDDLYSTAGPSGMRIISAPHDTVIDIILVHGPTGNRETTWTHRNGTFWPELLANTIPNASVMTYGYDTEITKFWGKSGHKALRYQGKRLLYAVSECRANHRDRPIFFIAHSLGGLVVEQALLFCRGSNPDLQNVLKSTTAVMFMGTPHSSTSLTVWGRTLAKYLQVMGRANIRTIGAMQSESDIMAGVGQEFQQLLQKPGTNLRVFCFYESAPVAGVGKIVSDTAAVLRQFPSAGIAADHRDMTKFAGSSDAGFQLAVNVMRMWIEEKQEEECEGTEAEAEGTEQRETGVRDGEGTGVSPAKEIVQNIHHSCGNVDSKGGQIFHGGQTFSGGQSFNSGGVSS